MLRISSATFRRKVDDGVLPKPSLALGERNPRWSVLALQRAMKGIPTERAISDDDILERIGDLVV